ncbi:class F sortase [Micrococcaceae bacterium Sec5.7]
MKNKGLGRRGRRLVSAAAILLLTSGAITVGIGLQSHASPGPTAPTAVSTATVPSPPASAPSSARARPSAPPKKPSPAVSSGPVLPGSAPARVAIPAIGVDSSLLRLGKDADGTIAVPPGDAGSPAGWYRYSPTPGEPGSSVILGHVNSVQSPVGVFYRLHEMKNGQQVSVTRDDRTVAVFRVYRVKTYDKNRFPTIEVYKNAERAELRLITCGGYQPSTGEYTQNTVAYAYLISSHLA